MNTYMLYTFKKDNGKITDRAKLTPSHSFFVTARRMVNLMIRYHDSDIHFAIGVNYNNPTIWGDAKKWMVKIDNKNGSEEISSKEFLQRIVKSEHRASRT